MTEQQEYIIRADQLRAFEKTLPKIFADADTRLLIDRDEIIGNIRSRPAPPADAPLCHATFVPITQDEYDYLMKGWGNEHIEQIDEDVRQRQAAYVNCCNCGFPKTSDGEPNCNECAFSEQHDAAIRKEALDRLFPENTNINSNGDLDGGWELDPKPIFALKKKIESNPQYEEEPEAEVIEVVIRAIKAELRREGAQ